MDQSAFARSLRQPKSAAVAGLVFGVILIAVLILLQSATPSSVAESGRWIDDYSGRGEVVNALTLIPFAGIAFLWFLAVVRSHLGHPEDRFFETVFLGSGLLFVAMLFAAAAVLGSVLSLKEAGVALEPGTVAQAWVLAATLLGQFGARMAAVFAIALSSAGLRGGNLPRWIASFGYFTGVILLLTPPIPHWAQLLFPLWVIALSLLVLVRRPSTVQL